MRKPPTKLEDLIALRDGIKAEIRCTRTDIERPEYTLKQIKEDEKTIAVIQRRIDDARDRLANGPVRLKKLLKRLDQLNKLIKAEQHKDKIERLLKLVHKVNSIKDTTNDECE
jgi:DNA repair ATPase RecN